VIGLVGYAACAMADGALTQVVMAAKVIKCKV
jgi:hypothetical protein